jgi:hypothetical protein
MVRADGRTIDGLPCDKDHSKGFLRLDQSALRGSTQMPEHRAVVALALFFERELIVLVRRVQACAGLLRSSRSGESE